MRTTLDLPDELLRHAKARAALRGMKLKDFVAEALHAALYYRAPSNLTHVRDEPDQDALVLSDGCRFPLIRGACGPALKDASEEKLNQILEDEEVDHALGTRRR